MNWLTRSPPIRWLRELLGINELLTLVKASLTKEGMELMTLAELKTKVEQAVTVEESAVTLISGIAQQLKDAIANGADPAAIQAIADELDKGTADLSAAVTANTTPAPTA